MSHYFRPEGSTTEDIEKFSVSLTEGITEIVPVQSRYQSQDLENRNPRNLSLLLTDSTLMIGMAQQYDHTARNGTSWWQCYGSYAALDVGSQEVPAIIYYQGLYSRDGNYFQQTNYLSFSWSQSCSTFPRVWLNMSSVLCLLLFYILF